MLPAAEPIASRRRVSHVREPGANRSQELREVGRCFGEMIGDAIGIELEVSVDENVPEAPEPLQARA